MQSVGNTRYPVRTYLVRATELIVIASLLFLCYWQIINRETTMVKVGMTHLFSPRFVGMIPYLLSGFALAGACCLVFWAKGLSVIPGLLVFSLYTGYSVYLVKKTGSSCGCSNIFFDINLNTQIMIGASLILLCTFLLIARSRQIVKG